MSMIYFTYPVDIEKCIITDTPEGHASRVGYKGTLAYDIASIGGIKLAVFSSMSGTVKTAGWSNYGYGNEVVIESDAYKIQYAHLDSYSVHVGDNVQQGQMIGIMGTTGNSTGVHLHWAVMDKEGKPFDPIKAGLMLAIEKSSDDENYNKIDIKIGDKIRLKSQYDYVNIRSKPSTNGIDLGDLPPGVNLEVVEVIGDWVGVKVYIHQKYITT